MNNAYEKVSVEQAAKELNVGVETLHSAMEQQTLPMPLGYCVKHDSRTAYVIYRGLLEQFKALIEGKGGTYEPQKNSICKTLTSPDAIKSDKC